jgi:hypothetical protein
VPGGREELLKDRRVHSRLVGDHLDGRDLGCVDGPFEEPMGRLPVSVSGHEHVDDLVELVAGAVDVAPLAGDLHVRLVHEPAIPDAMPTRPSSVGR